MNQYNQTIYASYIGYITQAIVNNLAPLLFLIFMNQFGLSLVQITSITTINFVIQLIVDFIAAKYVDKIGYRISIVAAHIFSALGLLGMGIFPFLLEPYIGLLLSVFLYAIGGGLIEVLISPIVEACPSDNKKMAMSLLHSFYCWGTVAVVGISTLLLQILGKGSWRILTLLWALVPLGNAIWFTKVPIETLTEEGEGMSMKELFQSRLFWIFVCLMICAGASEQGMSQWASAFAESGLHVSKFIGDLAGPCFFSILMGSSRAFFGKFGEKMDLMKFIQMSAILCIVSYMIASLSPIPLLSLLSCGICGLSVGIMWPGVFSLASKNMPKGGTAMFALLALGGDVGCSSGPSLVGVVSNIFGKNLKIGLFCAIAFPAFLLYFTKKLKKFRL
ncbi:MAG: MFS transporter [Firmicutes bacterium]|nr:MFS transporter [Bacillota bacterium]